MAKKVEDLRTPEEAWKLALENKELLLHVVNKFVYRGTRPSWYTWDSVSWMEEVQSIAWEAFYRACLKWNPAKGKLSTYAVPTMERHLYRHYARTVRAGGNSRVRGSHNGDVEKQPALLSLEDVNARRQSRTSEDVYDIEEVLPPVWSKGEVNSFEDSVIARVDGERFVDAVESVMAKMSEPHRTIFEMVHFTQPTHDRTRYSLARGTGLTLDEVEEETGIDKSMVHKYLGEAEEFVRNHLTAQGFREEVEDVQSD